MDNALNLFYEDIGLVIASVVLVIAGILFIYGLLVKINRRKEESQHQVEDREIQRDTVAAAKEVRSPQSNPLKKTAGAQESL